MANKERGEGNEGVILVGAGGHALSLAEFAAPQILGYLAKEENPKLSAPWLGTDDEIRSYVEKGVPFHVAFVYSRMPRMESRRRLIEMYEQAGAKFASLIAPTAIITPGAEIGEGCAIMAGAIINRAKLGRNVIVNSGAIVEHDCEIGDNTFIGPGAVIGGFTKIGNNCFIGLGARIANGIEIADRVTVGMGEVVTRTK